MIAIAAHRVSLRLVTGAVLASALPCAFAQQAWPAGYMMMVASATPADIIMRLHREIIRALNTSEVKARLAAEGSEVIGSSTEQASATLLRDIDTIADIIRRTGIKQ